MTMFTSNIKGVFAHLHCVLRDYKPLRSSARTRGDTLEITVRLRDYAPTKMKKHGAETNNHATKSIGADVEWYLKLRCGFNQHLYVWETQRK